MATLYRSYESIPVRAAVRFPLRLEIVLRTAEREYPGDYGGCVGERACCLPQTNCLRSEAEVRFELTMPAAIMGGANDVLLHCLGRIVRHQRLADKLMAAAVIDEYSFRG